MDKENRTDLDYKTQKLYFWWKFDMSSDFRKLFITDCWFLLLCIFSYIYYSMHVDWIFSFQLRSYICCFQERKFASPEAPSIFEFCICSKSLVGHDYCCFCWCCWCCCCKIKVLNSVLMVDTGYNRAVSSLNIILCWRAPLWQHIISWFTVF